MDVLEPKTLKNGKTEWILGVVLANFAGTKLKLSQLVLIDSKMPVSAIDFEWACS